MCSRDYESEMRAMYVPPKVKKPRNTRERCLRKFLFQKLYHEYILYKDSLPNQFNEPSNSTYYVEYCKNLPQPIANDEGEVHYPLYSSTAITYYNADGDIRMDFKKRDIITRPVEDQQAQFG